VPEANDTARLTPRHGVAWPNEVCHVSQPSKGFTMRTEKARERRLRKLAANNAEVFRKVRRPFWEGDLRIVYILVNDRNSAVGYWGDLDAVETNLAERYSPARPETSTAHASTLEAPAVSLRGNPYRWPIDLAHDGRG
jgi:hypothetical protein